MRRKWSVTPQISPILFGASLLLISLIIQVSVIQATPETFVKVEPSITSVNVGEQITLNITVVDVQNLYSVEVILYWNSTLLEAVTINTLLGETDGVLHNPIYIVENSTQEGKYVLAATSTFPALSFNGSGNIVRITFNVTNMGDSKMDLETQLYDYPPPDRWPPISFPIEHVTIDGLVNIVPEIPYTIILPWLMVLTIFVVVLLKNRQKLRV